MLVKFMARGAGGGAGPVDYLLGKDRQREGASVLRGDPEQVRELIDSAGFSQNYTSAVLSFEESEISEELRQKCMDEFEQVLMPGLERDQYSTLWVEHSDKGRVELNVVIPNIELQSGKRLQPYYDRADRARVDAWKTAINAEHDLADPSDPTRKRALSTASDLPRDRKELAEALTRGLLAQAEEGRIKSREDVLEALQGVGLEIARETKSSISIKPPDGGQNIRLKGAIYERDFRLSEELRTDIERAGQDYAQQRRERATGARERLTGMLERRAEENRKRYKRPQQTHAKELGRELDVISNSDINHDRARLGGDLLAGERDSEPLRGTGEVAENERDEVRRPEAALRRDRSESVSLRGTGRIQDIKGAVNEPDRETASADVARSRGRKGSHARDLRGFADRVRTNTERERPASRASRALERAISASRGAVEHIKKALDRARAAVRKRSRGMDLGR
ncbi:relaxase/mobilization nuclease domain-containing protein [Providencia manganoxydans]|uniref:relaxase/mobilization nuclease domain-containing protein n=1 Tax=Providencia manganoxydans TaxID=2923283 RepID=UPI003F68D0E9